MNTEITDTVPVPVGRDSEDDRRLRLFLPLPPLTALSIYDPRVEYEFEQDSILVNCNNSFYSTRNSVVFV